ncbi:MAG: ABC transporter ATP-binding protein [Acidobacteria bacterium]|nr:ABC transporter ATP-binding protein [Acidobacteriota bacterium]
MIRPVKDLQPLFPFLRPYRDRYLLGFGSLLVEMVFWVAVPQIIRHAIDALQQNFDAHSLVLYSGMLIGAALCKAVFLFWSRMILIGISRDVEYDLRNELYRHLSRQSLRYFQNIRTGDLMSRATNDLNAVRMLLGPGVMYSLRTVVILAGAATIMFSISVRLSLYSFVLVPFVVMVVSFFGHRIHVRFESIQAMLSSLSAKVQESLSGIRILRAYAQEEADIARFRELNEEFVDRNKRLIRVWGMFYPSLDMLMGLTFALVLWLGGREVVAGRISIGSFVAFNVYMAQLSWPMIALGWVVSIFQRGTASLGRLNQILSAKPEIADSAGVASALPSHSGNGDAAAVHGVEIVFRNLSFAYNGREVLRDVNITIPAGSTLAIVGPTGSGKSTLVSLIPRLYDAPPGTIFLNGSDIRDYRLQDLRRIIGFVPQETFLFSETVRENIAFGVDNATEQQVRHAAEIAGLLPDIEAFPRQFETLVGERGITVSGGQKQRAAIARAIMRNPRLLVLDDALSSVDTYTEEIILNRLKDIVRGRTTILISHRVSTVKAADQIIVLENGTIAERGTHDELLQHGTYYPELYRKQLLEEELERA